MSYSVGELARLSGVSVRTLHHYDEIGLLVPSERSAAGYRRYSREDAERLHHILAYRELGFGLAAIGRILDDPAADASEHLRRQHAHLMAEVARLQGIIKGIEAMMNAKDAGVNLTPDEMREVFGSFNPADHAEEARERWGDTDAYRRSVERTARYDREHWLRIREEAEQITRQLASAMATGAPPASAAAMDLVEQHRLHISRWFYDCDHATHRGLGDLYVSDPRFARHYDRVSPGLAAYIGDAIAANADRAAASGRPES